MDIDDATDSQGMNKETPPLDSPVAVEWWHTINDDGEPELDTHHGFHDAERFADGSPPAVQDGEIVTASGVRVTADSDPNDMRESRYLYLTHREALSRDISPCVECFPAYATDRKLTDAREGDGILTEPGVEGAVFPVWTRYDTESGWDLDSVHESYTSLLYRIQAIREHAGGVGGRLRYSFALVRRCEYATLEDAAAAEPAMAHVTDLRTIQPEELPTVRDRLGDELLSTPVAYEHRFTDTGDVRASRIHRARNPPCGYEREMQSDIFGDTDDALSDLLESEPQTVADVIRQGTVVAFCESCFPDLASWETVGND